MIFQASTKQGKIPPDWKLVFISYYTTLQEGRKKQGCQRQACVVDVGLLQANLDNIIHSHVITHLERNNNLSDYQHGFKKRRSRGSQLITTITL